MRQASIQPSSLQPIFLTVRCIGPAGLPVQTSIGWCRGRESTMHVNDEVFGASAGLRTRDVIAATRDAA